MESVRKCQKRDLIRVAVVGGGAFGEAHLRTFSCMPLVEVAGVYTLEKSRGEFLSKRYGGKNFEALQELCDDGLIDLVTIATPEDQHSEPFRKLAAAGKAIYVEKPLATTLDEASRILELSQSIYVMSGHCLRFEQRIAATLQRLEGVRKHHLNFRNRRTRLEKKTYGRVHPAHAMLCHEVDLSNAFAESVFRRVVAMETHYHGSQADGMTIMIEYENGVTSTVEGGWYLPEQSGCIENDVVSVVSDQGIDELVIPNHGHWQVTGDGLCLPNTLYGYTVNGVEYGPLRAAFDYMVTCLLERTIPHISTVRDAYAAVELIEAAMLSVREGRWVDRGEISREKEAAKAVR